MRLTEQQVEDLLGAMRALLLSPTARDVAVTFDGGSTEQPGDDARRAASAPNDTMTITIKVNGGACDEYLLELPLAAAAD